MKVTIKPLGQDAVTTKELHQLALHQGKAVAVFLVFFYALESLRRVRAWALMQVYKCVCVKAHRRCRISADPI